MKIVFFGALLFWRSIYRILFSAFLLVFCAIFSAFFSYFFSAFFLFLFFFFVLFFVHFFFGFFMFFFGCGSPRMANIFQLSDTWHVSQFVVVAVVVAMLVVVVAAVVANSKGTLVLLEARFKRRVNTLLFCIVQFEVNSQQAF